MHVKTVSNVFLTSFWDVVWIYGRNVNTSRTPHTAAEAFLYVKISRYAYSKMKDPLPAYFAYIKYSRMLHTKFLQYLWFAMNSTLRYENFNRILYYLTIYISYNEYDAARLILSYQIRRFSYVRLNWLFPMQTKNKNCSNEPRRGATKVGSGDLPEDSRHTIFETENHRGCCAPRYAATLNASACPTAARLLSSMYGMIWFSFN